MKSFLAVLQREITEQRRVFAAAGLIGLIPLLLPLLPGAASGSPSDTRTGAALFLSVVLTAGLALLLGSSALARDLGERRLGFYFARPIPGWAIGAGKLAGAAILILVAGAGVLLPTLLIGERIDASPWFTGDLGPARFASAWAGALLLLLFAAHSVGTMLRSRSPWLALDLVGTVLVTVLVLSLRNRLLLEGAWSWWLAGRQWLLAALLLSLIAATAVQIVQGRSDLRRGHRWLSLTLWGLLLGVSLTVNAAAARFLETAPADLVEIQQIAPAPAGRWISLSGPAGRSLYGLDLHSFFVLDTASGRSFRIRVPGFMSPGSSPWWSRPQFSADGRWAVWQEFGDFAPTLARLDLTRPGAEPLRIPVSGLVQAISLSPDGRRLALLQENRLLLEETATGRLIDSFPQPSGELLQDGGAQSVHFLRSGRLRIYRYRFLRENGKRTEKMVISEIDPVTRRTEKTGELARDGFQQTSFPYFSPDGERLLFVGFGVGEVFDARTGALLSTLLPLRKGHPDITFLADGRIARIVVTARESEIRIYDRDGKTEMRRFNLPGARIIDLGSQAAPGLLALGTHDGNPLQEPGKWKSLLLDLETGSTRSLGDGLRPAGYPTLPPASFGSRLFVRDGNRLVSIDPETGRETAIAMGS